MTNRPNGTLYVGVTDNLALRAWQHRTGLVAGFTKRYGLTRLVYAEHHPDIRDARQREQNLKHYRARVEGPTDPAQQSELGRSLRATDVIRGWPGQARP